MNQLRPSTIGSNSADRACNGYDERLHWLVSRFVRFSRPSVLNSRMPVIECPSCQRKLNLKQMPAASKIKCPGCSNPISLPATTPQTAVAGGLTPEDEGFDFGQVQFPSAGPTAVSTFQTGGQSLNVYQGPIPGDPLGEELGTVSEGDDPVPDGTAPAAKPAGKLSPIAIAGILGGTAVLLLVVIVVGALVAGGGGGDSSDDGTPKVTASSDEIAQAKQNVPDGYDLVDIDGTVVYLPKGESRTEDLRTVLDFKAVLSNETRSYYFYGVMDGGSTPFEDEVLRKKIRGQLKGDFLGGTPTQRNGYSGIKGVIDQSLSVPRMRCETFQVDGRICVLGVAPYSDNVEPGTPVDRAAEQKEMNTFHDSFKVGAPGGGGLFW